MAGREILKELESSEGSSVRGFIGNVQRAHSKLQTRLEATRAELIFLESQLPYESELLESLDRDAEKLESQTEGESSKCEEEAKRWTDTLAERAPELDTSTQRSLVALRLLSVARCLNNIQQLHQGLLGSTNTYNWTNVINNFELLQELRQKLTGSKCTLIHDYLVEVVNLWKAELCTRLSTYVNFQLEKIKWPFENRSSWPPHDSQPAVNLASALEAWYVVAAVGSEKTDTTTSDCANLPFLDNLFAPLEKRFNFHFYGDRRTNANEKPEWFFTLILEWCQWHGDYLDERVQPMLSRRKCQTRLASTLIDRLIGLARQRLAALLSDVADDAALFTHVIDETVLFEMHMNNALNSASCGCLDLIAENVEYRQKWLDAETEANTLRAEQTLNESDQAWKDRYEQTSDEQAAQLVDTFKVPVCADEFILLIQLITERYRFVQSAETRLLMCQLQQHLIDDYRIRLLQIYRKLDSAWATQYIAMMNAVAYIKYILDDWSYQPFFVHLQTQSHKATAVQPSTSSGVFDGMSELYASLWDQMCASLVDSIIQGDCAPALHQYKRLPWYQVSGEKGVVDRRAVVAGSVSPAFCPLLLQLRTRLADLTQAASQNSYPIIGKRIAASLAVYMQREVVQQTGFSEQGAGQMLYDVLHALVPLLAAYNCCEPERLPVELGELIECLQMLGVPVPTAVLINDTLRHDMQANIGGTFELNHLDNAAVARLLAQRQDLPS